MEVERQPDATPELGFPLSCTDAETTQRFSLGDWVSHNGGLIETHTKRRVMSVLGYDRNGGVRYGLAQPDGSDRGLAYDCELDMWPGDDALPPMTSPRTAA